MKELLTLLTGAFVWAGIRLVFFFKKLDKKDLMFGAGLFVFFIVATCFVGPVALVYYSDFLSWKPTAGMEFY